MATFEKTAKNASEIAKRALKEALVDKYRQGDYSMLSPAFAGPAAVSAVQGLANKYYDFQKGNVGKVVDWINSEDSNSGSPAAQNASTLAMMSRPGQTAQPDVVQAPTVQPSQQALVGATRYEDRNGNEIAPQTGRSFADRPGAFTAPNNDPNTPGMNIAPFVEETLLPFNPDDARFAKRNLEIAAQQGRHKAALENEAASREAERFRTEQADRALTRKQQAEDRAIQQDIQRKQQEYIADQQARAAEAEKLAIEWTRQNQGLAPTAENQKTVFEIQNRQNNINEYVGNHQYLSRLESQIPVIFDSLASGQTLEGIPPEVQSFIDQAAPQLESIPKEQRGAVLRSIQNELMSQIRTQKEIAGVKLQQANKQNFPSRGAGALDQVSSFIGQ